MGCEQSKQRIDQDEYTAREEAHLSKPSRCVIQEKELAHAQHLIKQTRMAIEIQLGSFWPEKGMKATQMITRQYIENINTSVHNAVDPNNGTMYYIKVHTQNDDWPWIHVKLFEPPVVTGGGLVTFRGLKKFHHERDLKVF